jgi:hypothetical protein
MFFRFGAAVVMVVVVSLLGIAIEKRTLALKRAISLQTYRADQLDERLAQLQLRCEQLGAPGRLLESVEAERTTLRAGSGRERLPERTPR